WETQFWTLHVENTELCPMLTTYDAEGKEVYHPDPRTFTEEQWDYLIERADEARAPELKAHYNHLAWTSPRKHRRFGKAAIDAYLELVPLLEEQNRANPGGGGGI